MQQQQALPGPPQAAAAAAAGAAQFPTLAPFPTCLGPPPAEAVSPISSRAPDSGMVNFDAAGFAVDEEALAGGAPGNRWPRQETVALLKIRSEMDAAFREATFKGPLWEEVSRKLEELGYKRSAKKCKEKFENVHKYYKRTKEGRAGRQDGKAYRFFSQLEALHNKAAAAAAAGAAAPPPAQVSFRMQPLPVSAVAMTPAGAVPSPGQQQPALASAPPGLAGIGGFAWNNSSSSSSGPESDDEDTEDDGVDGEGEGEGRKRNRRGSSRKMMVFFEGLMKRVTERQDEMQRRFLEAIEKREQERMIREESWRRQEMARFGREQELLAQERALAASRDAAVISYLQKITSDAQTTSPLLPPVSAVALATIPISVTETLPPTPQPAPQAQPTASKKKLAPAEEGGVGILESPLSSSRWPKAEVHQLIDQRSKLEARYQEAGPKGLLWEEISAGMRALGYDRSAKRCKEKWENINKYFKKVKDGNKRRPEDAKTCPYFHQLEALYRKKHHGDAGVMAFPPPPPPPPPAAETAGGGNSQPLPTTNNDGTLRKAEEAVKDLTEQTQRQSLDLDEYDSENMEQDDEEDVDDEDDDEDTKMQYKIQFQQHNVGGPGGSTSAAAPPPAAAGSFLAMVQ